MEIMEKVKRSLEGLNLPGTEVRVEPIDHNYIALMVSESFEGMSEFERQKMVWAKLLKDLDEAEQRRVEFVFTDSPSERETGANDEPDTSTE